MSTEVLGAEDHNIFKPQPYVGGTNPMITLGACQMDFKFGKPSGAGQGCTMLFKKDKCPALVMPLVLHKDSAEGKPEIYRPSKEFREKEMARLLKNYFLLIGVDVTYNIPRGLINPISSWTGNEAIIRAYDALNDETHALSMAYITKPGMAVGYWQCNQVPLTPEQKEIRKNAPWPTSDEIEAEIPLGQFTHLVKGSAVRNEWYRVEQRLAEKAAAMK